MESMRLGCDGKGNIGGAPAKWTSAANGTTSLTPSRRSFLLGTALAAVSWVTASKTALSDVAVGAKGAEYTGDILVSVFMRGGADGLNLVPPFFEDGYFKHRPSIGVRSPNDKRVNADVRGIDLDGRFGLHPAMAPLLPLYREGTMGIVHACGSMDQSRSHFEAMATMERGIPDQLTGAASGWLGRHLTTAERKSVSPLRAVAFSNIMPDSLRGATDAAALNSLADFRLIVPNDQNEHSLHGALADIYSSGDDAISIAGRETIAVLDTLNRLDPTHYKAANDAVYPKSTFGEGLRQVACLIKGGVGLEVACLDHRGPYLWDTHVAQDSVFAAQAGDLALGLAAFAKDLGNDLKRVTIVVMTEFGRRVQENAGIGTDHGRGGALFMIGGSVNGGKVHGKWPGLSDHQLDETGDLRVANDYRDVLAEVVQKRLHNNALQTIFPDYPTHPLGILRA